LDTAQPQSVELAHRWLREQQNPKTGLLRSYDIPGDGSAWTYDQAVGTLALLAAGDTATATRCADAMLQLRDAKHQAWADGHDSETKRVTSAPVAVGPNTWMGLAFLGLHRATSQTKYLAAAEQIGQFIVRLQLAGGPHAGAIAGGYGEDGLPFPWISTEHNADAVAFLAALADASNKDEYREAAVRIADWLDQQMWDNQAGCYHVGADNNTGELSSFPERLDSQTWTFLAQVAAAETTGWPTEVLGRARNGLSWIDQYQRECTYHDKKVVGFPKVTHGDRATPSFWSEGTAGYILAARRASHSNPQLNALVDSLRRLQRADGAIPYSVGISVLDAAKHVNPGDLVIHDFEVHPNRLGGEVSVHGDAEPDWEAIKSAGYVPPYSCHYEPDRPGYRKDNVHTGWQSFRLVDRGAMCRRKDGKWQGWASLGLDLGPLVNGKIKPLNAKAYRELSFWAKTENKDKASVNLPILLRDAHAKDFMPQIRKSPTPAQVKTEWQRYVLELSSVPSDVDLSEPVHVGFAFGADVGNPPGTIIYIDDVAFVGGPDRGSPSGAPHDKMPAVFPQHWPFGNVAATAWFIFVELDINPFSYRASRDED
jgi:hypothetical protein